MKTAKNHSTFSEKARRLLAFFLKVAFAAAIIIYLVGKNAAAVAEGFRAFQYWWLLPAALLNRKVRVLSRNPGKTGMAMSLIRINHPQIRLSSLRPVATGEWIARIYDALGSGGTFTLSSDYGSFTLLESDLTEKEWRECPRKVSLSPFEIKTLKIVFR